MRSGSTSLIGLGLMVAGTCSPATAADQSPALDPAVPDALIAEDNVIERAMARHLLHMLPPSQRKAIQESPSAGPWERAAPSPARALIGDNAEYERMSDWVSPELYARMSQGQINLVNAQLDGMDRDLPPVGLCFAPDADPEFVFAFNQLLEFRFQISFQQTSRWINTATDGSTGGQGTPITLTYSFVPDGTQIPDLGIGLGSGTSQLFAWLNSRYGNFNNWKPFFDNAFARWSELIGVDYVYEPNDDGVPTNSNPGALGVRGDVRIGAFDFRNDGNGGTLAYNNFPQDGDMIFDAFDTFYNNTGNNSFRLRQVISHEHGHGLGMLHVCPADGTKLMEPFIAFGFEGPQLDDVLNGQRHYGDILEPNDGVTMATDLGSVGVPSVISRTGISIDAPNDTDYFLVDADEPLQLNVLVSPSAANYRQGPQTFSCSSGNFTNYNEILDLRITVLSGVNFLILGSSDESSVGQSELLSLEIPAGPVYVAINGSGPNNIQRYDLAISTSPSSVGPCNDADIAQPFDTLNIDDVLAFLDAFAASEPAADIASPAGVYNIDDVLAFLDAFAAGCP